ncbi:MAG: hypothetical protein ACTS6G_05165 [Candidatus Hodgkinia cicadicola]
MHVRWLCSMCHGLNLSTGFASRISISVGIIASQAISEPGTQWRWKLSMILRNQQMALKNRTRSKD